MKKNMLVIVRWVVGILFIFSGLVKANDPLGLSYKMQEFFEVFHLESLNGVALAFSLIMNVFEVLAGVAVIIGWRMRLFSWLLLLLIIFFTFLTGYAYLSGNIKTCGCFGDCLPLTAQTSFIKDVILLVLILFLFINTKHIHAAFTSPLPVVLLLVCVASVSWMQSYVLHHLPFRDCLPYKVGDNILANMEAPDGMGDIYDVVFTYKHNGQTIDYKADNLPADLDSTYEFVDRSQKLVKKGVEPKIQEFALNALSGADTTETILTQSHAYVMLWINDFSNSEAWHNADFDKLLNDLSAKSTPFFIVTSAKEKAIEMFGNNSKITILVCDGTVIKTAARVNPTYFYMNAAEVKAKNSYLDIEAFTNAIGK
ncbi:BT_3928 family protein [Limnovirga soli]|uniref:DoxX family membrane protein n=1 Tax=Limnovirga soli TaxID=2656915 RepID=A0A8J8JT08_9BACT|nr:BT_3928 family protein [Limnovirga soli]NNV57557.1 DoxX family membrane protein [Limnovirga soli]